MAWWLQTNGNQTQITPANGKSFTLAEIYKLTNGGPIEAYRLDEDEWFVCNEDGKRLNLEPNIRATALYNVIRLHSTRIQDVVVGNVVIASTEEMNGPDEEEENDDTAQG